MQAWSGGERLHLGAEAEVISGTWHGRPAVLKKRRPRGWRHPDLDASLTKKRMTNEVKLTIWLARRGAPVPAIWDVDIDESKIIMERIEGKPLIEILQSNEHDEKLLIDVGKAIRELHRNAVNHGDLSTNNILITNQREVVLIDLGLSSREYDLEGFGIDLHVLHEILRASHPEVKGAMDLVLKGYIALDEELGKPVAAPGGLPPSALEVTTRLNQIMMRVRYHGG
ncbi:MAG: Kae1-associated kinase Bud32 [Euryarchaeota archaeon]|nr:Kae1-associated kinase Bud32 [Euryarchaeota archaeon]|tara:strand:- start:972 stop:1649 length:678 start_codon:yes stop_codon:yes gene_type:complete